MVNRLYHDPKVTELFGTLQDHPAVRKLAHQLYTQGLSLCSQLADLDSSELLNRSDALKALLTEESAGELIMAARKRSDMPVDAKPFEPRAFIQTLEARIARAPADIFQAVMGQSRFPNQHLGQCSVASPLSKMLPASQAHRSIHALVAVLDNTGIYSIGDLTRLNAEGLRQHSPALAAILTPTTAQQLLTRAAAFLGDKAATPMDERAYSSFAAAISNGIKRAEALPREAFTRAPTALDKVTGGASHQQR